MPARHWVDRDDEVATLDLLADSEQPVLVLTGEAGCGKTGLAVRWLHSRYSDCAGHLYADFNDDSDPADILGRWLRALGCDEDLSDSVSERRALFASMSATRPVVILLDNASTTEQVWPLLPTSPGCITVITSEHPLESLIKVGAHHLVVEPLDLNNTLALLQTLTEHVDTHPDVLRTLAVHSHGSPLAATMLAGQLRLRRRHTPLQPRANLPTLKDIAVMSYAALSPEAQRLYQLIAAHPSATLDGRIAAIMLNTSSEAAATHLAEIAEGGLITEEINSRFRVATTPQHHMRDLSENTDQATRTRIQQWYLHTTIAASQTLNPRSARHEHTTPEPTTPTFESKPEAMQWVEHELPALRHLLHQGHTHGNHAWVWQLAAALWTPLLKGNYNTVLLEIHHLAEHSAEQCARFDIQALMLSRQSWGFRNTGNHPQACATAERASGLAAAAGDTGIESTALSAAARARLARGHLAEAERLFCASRDLAHTIGDHRSVGLRTRHLGDCAAAQGDTASAAALYAHSATLLADDPEAWARATGKHAHMLIECNDPHHARRILDEPINIMSQSGSKVYLADLLVTLASADHALGERQTAYQRYSTALDLYTAAGRIITANKIRDTLAQLDPTTHNTTSSDS